MIRLAIIGTGGMANSHAWSFNKIRGCRVVACCDIVPGRAEKFAAQYGIPSAYTSAEEMLAAESLDAVSIVTTDNVHAECALLAIKHGLHVLCEKPLADNLKDAKRMAEAARRKGVLTTVNFSYRNAPATQRAAQMAGNGDLGRIIHVEGRYLQSWLVSKAWGDWHVERAWLWRLSTRHGSMGCLGDIGVHLYDLASFVVGDISEVYCDLETFKKDAKRIGEYVFDANDSMAATVRFANGALGALHSSRWATGHMNTVALRVHGDQGALDLNLDRQEPERLLVCIGQKALDRGDWKPVKCPKTPTMYQRFITSIQKGEQGQAGFDVGGRVQAYLDASFKSAKARKPVEIK